MNSQTPSLHPAAHVGDIYSDKPGTGARYNAGKMRVDLLPLRVLHAYHSNHFYAGPAPWRNHALNCLLMLAEWQERGEVDDLYVAMSALPNTWEACCQVFEYGSRKYTSFNWAKGMAWSIPLACAVRHLLKIIEDGQIHDDESGLPHVGHVYCNLCMLLTYHATYREGDDRPRSLCPRGAQ
jgi:Domain of unknown function (DUF5664)